MAIRVVWDKYETVLLIDAYIRSKQEKTRRQEIVKEVSLFLRHRAISSGLEIDDVFRNENGISMQMKIIGGLIEGKTSGLHNASKLFCDMVRLYKDDYPTYTKMLEQAKGEHAMEQNIQDNYFAWLSQKVRADQLSGFFIAYKSIEAFCLREKILTRSLFATTDLNMVEEIERNILHNQKFRSEYFFQLGKMKKAISFYIDYLETVMVGNGGVQKQESSSIFRNRQEKEHTINQMKKDQSNGYSVTAMGKDAQNEVDQLKVWDFSDPDIDFMNIIPKSVEYFGDVYKCSDWTSMYVQSVKCLLDDYPSVLKGMAGHYIREGNKIILAEQGNLQGLLSNVLIDTNLYLNTGLSVNEIVTVIRMLMDKCNMDYNNLSITYCMKCLEKTNNVIIVSRSENEEQLAKDLLDTKRAFETWMIEAGGLAIRSAQSYSSAVNVAGQYAVKWEYSEVELWDITNFQKVSEVIDKLWTKEEFVRLNEGQHNRYRAALSKYLEYCHKQSSNQEIIISTASNLPNSEQKIKNNRKAFMAWAKSQGMQSTEILLSMFDIKNCSKFLKENGLIIEDSLLAIEDEKRLVILWDKVKSSNIFSKLNEQYADGYRKVMKKLLDYRHSMNGVTEVDASTSSVLKHKGATDVGDVNDEIKKKYTKVLQENFTDGFRLKKTIDRNRFRMYFSDLFGSEIRWIDSGTE